MKNIVLLFMFPVFVFAQKEEVIYKKLANQTCDCVKAKNTEKTSELELGICVIGSLGKLSEKEKKVIKYDTNSDSSLDKVSEQVGMQMVSICPDVFSSMLQNETTEDTVAEDVAPDPSVSGVFQSIVSNDFKTIVILDDTNQKREYIWLYPFEGDSLLIKNKLVKGDKIRILYREQNFFDPKINDYRMYNEILEVELL
jgi:hypothetical protein